MSKYGNRKTQVFGITFDSKAEALRYLALFDMRNNGEISHLRLQPEFELLPAFTSYGQRYRGIKYRADFGYFEGDKQVVEDVKGGKATQTPVFLLKAKLFRYQYRDVELRVIEA